MVRNAAKSIVYLFARFQLTQPRRADEMEACFGEQSSMRFILAVCVVLFWEPTYASTFLLSVDESYVVTGNFPVYPDGSEAFTHATVTLVETQSLPVVNPYNFFDPNAQQSGYDAVFSVASPDGNFGFLETCASNVGGPCYSVTGQTPQPLNVSVGANDPGLNLFDTFRSYNYALPSNADLSPYFAFEVTLPDGFSIAAIPEISTWAMLLIGFAGIGFAGWRKSLPALA
jgi:hypothetical protein